MNDGRLSRAAALFNELVGVPVDQRSSLLAVRCDGDEALRTLVGQLLAHDERGLGDFLHRPEPPRDGAGQAGAARRLAAEAAPLPPPSRIGRYRIVGELGRGGAGVVYEAVQDSPSRAVALKVIGAGYFAADAVRRFTHEAEILGALQHPGIAQIYEAGTAEVIGPLGVATTVPFFAMELVRGDTLTRFAERAGLDVRARLELLARVCDAVQYAHQKGVIHRDLKPGNILVVEEGLRGQGAKGPRGRASEGPGAAGAQASHDVDRASGAPPLTPRPLDHSAPASRQPKVLDFGIARATGDDFRTLTLRTEVGQIVGTVPYMSPEQLSGDSRQIDTRSDVYALGVVLFELLAGALPHDVLGCSLPQAVRIVRDEPPRPLGALRPALRGEVETICAKALHRDREQRYQSAAALADDIRRYLSGEPIEAKRDSLRYVLGKRLRQYWGTVAAAAAFVLLLTVGFATSLRFWLQAERMLEEKEQQRQLAEKRAKETAEVAGFQSQMLSGIDANSMGRRIKELLRQQVRASLARESVGAWPDSRYRTAAELDAELASFDQRAESAEAADVARRVMDEFILRRAADTIEAKFAGQPLVQATLYGSIGEMCKELGLYDDAEKRLRAAIAILRQASTSEPEALAKYLNDLSIVRKDRGDRAEAEVLLRESVAIRRELFGNEHEKVAIGLVMLAEILQDNGDYGAAEPLFVEALDVSRRSLGDEHATVAYCKSALGTFLTLKGDYAAAEPLARETLETQRRILGDEHVDVLVSLNALAVTLQAKGEHAASEPLLREALAIGRRRWGDEHSKVVAVVANLANALRQRNAFDDADALYREYLPILRRLLGDANNEVARLVGSYALLLKERGDYVAAEPLYREALAIQRRVLGNGHDEVARSIGNLAALLRAKGDNAAAEPLYREALAIWRANYGDEHAEVASASNGLATLLGATERRDEAERLFREVLELRRRLLGSEHLQVAVSMHNLADLLINKGELDSAEGLARDALAMFRRLLGDQNIIVARSANTLGVLLYRKGDLSGAETLLLESLAVRRKLLGDAHPEYAGSLTNVANVRCALSDFGRAERLYREALAVAEKRLMAGHPQTRNTLIGLGACLTKLGCFGEAERFLLRAGEGAGAPADRADPDAVAVTRLIELYEAWHAVDPHNGSDAKAAKWKAKLAASGASTRDAAP